MIGSKREIYFSSSAGSFSEVRKKQITYFARINRLISRVYAVLSFEDLEVDIEQQEALNKKVKLVQKDIIGLYKNVGIEIGYDDFSDVVFIDERKTVKLGRNLCENCGGFYDRDSDFSYVFINTNDVEQELDVLLKMHHEIHHSLTRKVEIVRSPNQLESSVISRIMKKVFRKKSFKVNSFSGGYVKTRGLVEGKEIERGLLLEEGVVHYFAVRFCMDSKNREVEALRKKYIAFFKEKFPLSKKELVGKSDLEKDRLYLLAFLFMSSTDKYFSAYMLISKILKAASSSNESSRSEMKKLLLQARLDWSKTRKLVDSLNEIFGEKVAKDFFSTEFNEESISKLVTKLNLLLTETQAR